MQPEKDFRVHQNPRVQRNDIYGSCFIVAFSAVVFSWYGLELPLYRDNAIYLYSAQRLLEGVPPYISIFDVKTPLTSFVTALLLIPSQSIFDEPLHGVRVGYMVIVTATALLTYRLSVRMFDRSGTALFAPLAMLGFQGYIVMAAVGARPKVLLLLFMLFLLIFLWDRRWFAAGLASALCFFTWQPSAIVLIAALVFAFVTWRQDGLRAPVRLLGGFILVTAVLSAYFIYKGAFREFLDGSFLVHLFFLERTSGQIQISNIVYWIKAGFPFSSSLIVLGLICIVPYFASDVWKEWTKNRTAGPELAYLLMLVMFTVWSMLDFQGYPDFFVFLPFAALGIQLILQNLSSVFGEMFDFGARYRGFAAQLVLVCFLLAAPYFAFVRSGAAAGPTLSDQIVHIEGIISGALGGGDIGNKRVLVLEVPEIPALLRLENKTPFIVQMDGVDRYLASKFSNGIQGWFDAMEAGGPDLLIIRIRALERYSPENKKAVLKWLNTSFEPGPSNPDTSTWLPNRVIFELGSR
jgi:hypothetical protein